MGQPVRVLDLAQDLIRLSGLIPHLDIPIKIVGRRPGEKIQEALVTSHEADKAKKLGAFTMVASQEVNLSGLIMEIERLRLAVNHGNSRRVVQALQHLVPEFSPSATALCEDRTKVNTRSEAPLEPHSNNGHRQPAGTH